MSNPLNKARELGDSIVNSEQYRILKKCEITLHESQTSLSLYRAMDNSPQDMGRAMEDENIKTLFQARDDFNKLMRDINTIISYHTGYVSEKGSCGSCGGCK